MQNQNTGWLKLSVFSFIGIVIAMLILNFVTPNSMYGNSTYGMNMNGDAGAMMSTPMGDMQSQVGMNGMGSMMGNNNPGMMQTGASSAEIYSIKQALNQMQYQIILLQQNQMAMMNSVGMQGSMAGMSGMSGSSGMNGMSMMPMDSMSGMGMMNMMPMSGNMSNMSSGGSMTGGSTSGGSTTGGSASGGSMSGSGGSSGGMSMM